MPAIWSQIKPLLVHTTVGIVLEYLNCHMQLYSVCGGFDSCWPTQAWYKFVCLSVSSSWMFLAITITAAYPIISDGRVSRQKEQAADYQADILIEMGNFLNQACASLRSAHAWFLIIDPVRIIGMRVRVCVRVCVRQRLLIFSGMI